MRKLNFVVLLSILFVVSGFVNAQVSDKEAVMIPLENYLKGHATGDGEYFKKAFHTEGQLIFIRDRDGKYTTRSLQSTLRDGRRSS